ncbi:uncharacterized protein ACR2FA_003879 [Aphomia sociella]
MKYAVFFLLCCLALASAAPQLLAVPGALYPGFAPGVIAPGVIAPGVVGLSGLAAPRTLVAGPTVINGVAGVPGARLIAPGFIGTTLI